MTSILFQDGTPQFSYGDGLPIGHEYLTAFGCSEAKDRLAELRGALGRLCASGDASDKASLDDLNAAYASSKDFSAQGYWLATEPPVVALAQSTDGELVDFIARNYDHRQRHQVALDEALPELQEQSQQAAARLVDVEYLSPNQSKLYKRAIFSVGKPTALDIFEAAGMSVHGYCKRTGEIALANQFEDPESFTGVTDALRDTIFHEYTHAVGATRGRGFLWNGSGSMLLEEASTAHITAVALGRPQLPGTVNPDERVGLSCYDAELQFLDVLDEGLDGRMLARAYMETKNSKSQHRQTLLETLNATIRASLTEMPQGLTDVDALYEATPRYERSRLLNSLCTRVYGYYGIETVEESVPLDALEKVVVRLVPVGAERP